MCRAPAMVVHLLETFLRYSRKALATIHCIVDPSRFCNVRSRASNESLILTLNLYMRLMYAANCRKSSRD